VWKTIDKIDTKFEKYMYVVLNGIRPPVLLALKNICIACYTMIPLIKTKLRNSVKILRIPEWFCSTSYLCRQESPSRLQYHVIQYSGTFSTNISR